MKIKVAFLMHGIFFGGASRSLFLLLKSLSSFPVYECIIYTISVSSSEIEKDFLRFVKEIKPVKLRTISVNQVHRDSYVKYLVNSRVSCKKFVEILVTDKIDILHINSSVFPQVPEFVKKFSSIKVVTHIREYLDPQDNSAIHNYMVRKIVSFTDVLITISGNEAKSFSTHHNIKILPNPFEFKNITTNQSKFRELNIIAPHVVLVTMVSHFSKPKGHLNFLRALNHILISGIDQKKFRFIIVGYKDQRKWWKLVIKRVLLRPDYTNMVLKLINKLKLNGHIILVPYTNDVFSILHTSDIVVRPADSADPWGRDIIEAMAFGKPVIATGNSEFFVKNGITGFLVRPKDHSELAEKIKILISSKEMREKFGQEGYRIARDLCDLEKYGTAIDAVYSSLIKTVK